MKLCSTTYAGAMTSDTNVKDMVKSKSERKHKKDRKVKKDKKTKKDKKNKKDKKIKKDKTDTVTLLKSSADVRDVDNLPKTWEIKKDVRDSDYLPTARKLTDVRDFDRPKTTR